jgi:hypothetical protein
LQEPRFEIQGHQVIDDGCGHNRLDVGNLALLGEELGQLVKDILRVPLMQPPKGEGKA